MILILFSNKNYEHQSLACINSVRKHLPTDMKIVYFTIGYRSSTNIDNVDMIYMDDKNYSSFMYYKPELCLKALEMYPSEEYFFYADSDILFSKKINFNSLKCEETYPLAVFGPHECPYIWKMLPDGNTKIYNELALMNYLNVPNRTVRYQWACFQSFNRKCKDFYEEYQSLCQNSYLLNRQDVYFPFCDETPFNVCLWKRNAVKSLGFIFVNTHLLETIKEVEERTISKDRKSKVTDTQGADWEYIDDVDNIMFYHGFKKEEDINKALEYLTNTNQYQNEIIIINTYPDSEKKLQVLENYILQLKKCNRPILLSSHLAIPKSIIDLVDFYIFDKENMLLPEDRSPIKWFATDSDYIEMKCYVRHTLAITRSMFYSFNFVKNMGYKSFFFTEYDNILTDADIPKIDELFSMLDKSNKNIVAFCGEWESDNMTICQTSMFCANTQYFVENIPLPKTYEEWCNVEPYSNSYDILEKIFTKILFTKKDDVLYMKKFIHEFFNNSVIDVSHTEETESIVYNTEDIMNPLFFFVIQKDGYYELLIDDLIVKSGNYQTNTWFMQYFTIPQHGFVSLKFLYNNESLLTKRIDQEYLEKVKNTSKRKSISNK